MTETETDPDTFWTGWSRQGGPRAPWRRIVLADTEEACGRLLREATSHLQHASLLVLAPGRAPDDPSPRAQPLFDFGQSTYCTP